MVTGSAHFGADSLTLERPSEPGSGGHPARDGEVARTDVLHSDDRIASEDRKAGSPIRGSSRGVFTLNRAAESAARGSLGDWVSL